MKKLLTILALCLVCTFCVQAEPIDVEPNLLQDLKVQQGVVYSIPDQEVKSATTAEIVTYDTGYGVLSIDGGYAVDKQLMVAFVYTVGDFSQFGLNTPYADIFDIKLGIYGGYDIGKEQNGYDENDVWDYGLYANIITAKF